MDDGRSNGSKINSSGGDGCGTWSGDDTSSISDYNADGNSEADICGGWGGNIYPSYIKLHNTLVTFSLITSFNFKNFSYFISFYRVENVTSKAVSLVV